MISVGVEIENESYLMCEGEKMKSDEEAYATIRKFLMDINCMLPDRNALVLIARLAQKDLLIVSASEVQFEDEIQAEAMKLTRMKTYARQAYDLIAVGLLEEAQKALLLSLKDEV